jgi:phosphocarrier protein HPr
MSEESAMTEPKAGRSVPLAHEAGLHARPSVKLTKLAKSFASRVELALAEDGPWIDAKSIVKVMATKAPKDSVLHFRAEGEDAERALAALVALVESDFEDAAERSAGEAARAGTG